jgi:SAM-dependent methyltransferase
MIYLPEQNALQEIEDIYQGEEYMRTKKTEHVIFEQGNEHSASFRTTYSCFADLIEREMDPFEKKEPGPPHFLDIGCFDGKLLLELSGRFPNAVMHGFDVSTFIAELFPNKQNFSYFSGDMGKIEGCYDVISLVNVLAYVNDLSALMKCINRLLKPKGFIFFACANIKKNPFFLTFGDQCTFQTPINIRNLWRHFGYTVEFISDNSDFPRNIVGIARRTSKREEIVYEQDNTLSNSLQYLDHAVIKLLQVISDYKKENQSGRLVVLGRTNNAAWVHNLAGDDISCFTDENPNRIGRQFYQKDVIHPRHLTEDDLLLIPYAESSVALADKFANLYKAKTFNI